MRLTHFTHVLLALLLLAGTFVAYGAAYHIVDKKTADAAAAEAAIATKTQEAARAQEAQEQLAGLAADETQIGQYFVATRDVVPFLTAIESTGRTFGTKVSVVSVSAAPGKPHGHLTLSVSVTGAFDNVLRTVGALEYAPYDITLQNLTLDTAGNTPGAASEWEAAATFMVGTNDATSTKPVGGTPAKAAASSTPSVATSTATTTP
jgi:hypothetical protein